VLDLHKSWHGLHWLICQDAWQDGEPPLKYAILGEEEMGADLTGYGAPTLNTPDRVREIDRALGALGAAEVMRRFDGPRMEEIEIYPGGWAEDRSWPGDLRRDYSRLCKFYERAAKSGDAVLTWVE
jgi:hypothetical protein